MGDTLVLASIILVVLLVAAGIGYMIINLEPANSPEPKQTEQANKTTSEFDFAGLKSEICALASGGKMGQAKAYDKILEYNREAAKAGIAYFKGCSN